MKSWFYINKIDDKLKVFTEDIIITGHSSGGSISYYLYLLYVKRYLEDWGQKITLLDLSNLIWSPGINRKEWKWEYC